MRTQPWSFYATNMTLMFNFALVWDLALLWTLHCATVSQGNHRTAMWAMVGWILFSKLVKLIPFFWRNPVDIVLFPVYVLGAYVHSGLKLWAFFTMHNCVWGSRKNVN